APRTQVEHRTAVFASSDPGEHSASGSFCALPGDHGRSDLVLYHGAAWLVSGKQADKIEDPFYSLLLLHYELFGVPWFLPLYQRTAVGYLGKVGKGLKQLLCYALTS